MASPVSEKTCIDASAFERFLHLFSPAMSKTAEGQGLSRKKLRFEDFLAAKVGNLAH